ncbi:MAG: hypothetical protein ACP5NP_14590 [Acetobacteraceae bacterium]
MPKPAEFTMELEPELCDAFLAEAAATHQPATEVLQALMRDFVRRQRAARDHEAFLHRKVERARVSMRAGRGRPNAIVEAEAAARIAASLPEGDEAKA